MSDSRKSLKGSDIVKKIPQKQLEEERYTLKEIYNRLGFGYINSKTEQMDLLALEEAVDELASYQKQTAAKLNAVKNALKVLKDL